MNSLMATVHLDLRRVRMIVDKLSQVVMMATLLVHIAESNRSYETDSMLLRVAATDHHCKSNTVHRCLASNLKAVSADDHRTSNRTAAPVDCTRLYREAALIHPDRMTTTVADHMSSIQSNFAISDDTSLKVSIAEATDMATSVAAVYH